MDPQSINPVDPDPASEYGSGSCSLNIGAKSLKRSANLQREVHTSGKSPLLIKAKYSLGADGSLKPLNRYFARRSWPSLLIWIRIEIFA